MKKNCEKCAFMPNFKYLSPTSRKALGTCMCFNTPAQISREDTSYFDHAGKEITDCLCWELAAQFDDLIHVDEGCCSPNCAGCTESPAPDEILATILKLGASTMTPQERLANLFTFLDVVAKPGCHTPPLSVRFI